MSTPHVVEILYVNGHFSRTHRPDEADAKAWAEEAASRADELRIERVRALPTDVAKQTGWDA